MTLLLLLATVAFVPMIGEAFVSSRNERRLRALGAIEPADDVYRTMQVVYPACFLAMLAEGWARHAGADTLFAAGAVLFALAKALKYWAISSLGARWTFRVLVPPGAPLVARGPYRLLRHPNYVGVAGELGGMALMTHAAVSGALALIGFAFLMAARVRVEERALGLRSR